MEPDRADFVHEIEIATSPERLHAFLCDLHNHRALHPLIESIEDLPADPERPRARRYRVLDRVPLGPLRVPARYVASIEAMSDREIHGRAWQQPGIRVHTVYTLEPTATGVRLSERVSIEAPRLMRRFVISQARQAHHETLSGMRRTLQNDEPSEETDR